jgi:hypothetical protein
MVMLMFAALLRAPIARFRANGRDAAREPAMRRHQRSAEPAEFSALKTTAWAIVVALVAGHLRKAIRAGRRAILASLNRGCIGCRNHHRLCSCLPIWGSMGG